MKKILTLLMIFVALFTFVACDTGNSSSGNGGNGTSNVEIINPDITEEEKLILYEKYHLDYKNIFESYQDDIDRGPFRDSVYVYGPMLPRTYFFGLKFTM